MEEIQGLAGMGDAAIATPIGSQPGQQELGVQEVMMLLQQGANPQELLEMGVPANVIERAMQLMVEMQNGQVGLAGLA